MAVNRSDRVCFGTLGGPYLLAAHLLGLAAVYAGERLVGGDGASRWVTSGVGGALVLGSCLGWLAAFASSSGAARKLEQLCALLSVGGLAAIGIYLLGSDLVLGPQPVTPEGREGVGLRQLTAAAWPVVLICAVAPLVFVQWSARSMSGARVVEIRRASASARSGAMIAAFLCTLFLINAIANRKDVHVDLSYFKRTTPSDSSKELVTGMDEDTQAILFFEMTSEVLPAVREYFEALVGLSPHFKVSIADPALTPDLAEKHRVVKDGAVVVTRKENSQKIQIGADMKDAKRRLKNLDSEFQQAVLKLRSERKTIYFVVGHQERSTRTDETDTRPQMSALKEFIEKNNFTTRDLGAVEGLSHGVPEDAALLIWMDPASDLFPGELDAMKSYLRQGGRLLLTLDPDGPPVTKELLAFLGLTYTSAPVANEKAHIPLKRVPADKYNMVTNSFSSHPQVGTLAKANKSVLVLFPKTGSLEKAPDTGNRITFTVRSPMGSWTDADRDMVKGETEQPTVHKLVAAITGRIPEHPTDADAGPADEKRRERSTSDRASDEMRVVVFGDTDLFSDAYIGFRIGLMGHPGNYQLLADSLKWLLGEGRVSGISKTEEDIKIVHSRDEDVLWFYATVFAVPLLILSVGVATRWGRGRRRRGR